MSDEKSTALSFATELDNEFLFSKFCLEILSQADYSTIVFALIEAGYRWHLGYITLEHGLERSARHPVLVVDVRVKTMWREIRPQQNSGKILNVSKILTCVAKARYRVAARMLNSCASAAAAKDKICMPETQPAGTLSRPKI